MLVGLLVGLFEWFPMWSLPRSVMLSQACQHAGGVYGRDVEDVMWRAAMGEGEKEGEVLAESHQWSFDAVRVVRGGFAMPLGHCSVWMDVDKKKRSFGPPGEITQSFGEGRGLVESRIKGWSSIVGS